MDSGAASSNASESTSAYLSTRLGNSIESPALIRRAASGPAAFEMKCLIDERLAAAIESFLAPSLTPDPFAHSAHNGHYLITTLSTDTPELSVFHRQEGYGQRKFRIRRYGSESLVYLERKTRRGHKVSKHRTAAEVSELSRIISQGPSEQSSGWPGDWFQSQIIGRRLQPVCLMTYERRAWFGDSEHGSIRLTFDRDLCGAQTSNWLPEFRTGMQSIVGGGVICEFKFRETLPQVFKAAIQEFALTPGGFSKYRNCMSVLTGLALQAASQIESDKEADRA